MRECVTKEDNKRKDDAQERRGTKESNEEEKMVKRVKFMQEREYTDEDRAFQEDLFGPAEHESKRKESSKEQGAPESKRRRTQEEED
eukprot:2378773-Karenia_brevis.AAC.1